MVQEYERAVVFRLGRLRSGGAKGPGLFFIMPCVDSYKKVDLRTVSFDVPPQEVRFPPGRSGKSPLFAQISGNRKLPLRNWPQLPLSICLGVLGSYEV